jgi:aminomethyltransferase
MAELRRTRLYIEHVARGARMAPFAGWELPLYFAETGASAEHRAVREGAGLFDIDHMARFAITGSGAEGFLDGLLTVDVPGVPVMKARYALLPYDDGGLVDDAFLYRLDDAWWLIGNAANREKDLRWLSAHAGAGVALRDLADETCLLALQGPRAQAVLARVADTADVPFHTLARGTVAGAPALIAATGYAGEYGYELYFPPEHATAVWRALIDAGAVPAGLAARDSLRLEAALPLYGHEIAANIDPFTAGLGRFVRFDGGAFIGRDRLLKYALEGTPRVRVGLRMIESAVPRAGYTVWQDGTRVGEITSGGKSPTLDRFIALAIVDRAAAEPGTPLSVEIRGTRKQAEVVLLPFYTPAYRR